MNHNPGQHNKKYFTATCWREEGEIYFSFSLLKKKVANGKSTSIPSYIAW
jgi:hypothetical protein